ncbi:hypothetical protein WA026_000699 [Henosepilachna vigintioctopunctata]|uniref:Uncharacterized protein n=1 Tax=Henosepilachna vigintioctopunctata TaxID=420089 RepID=A0AAW1V4N3_9CUCU
MRENLERKVMNNREVHEDYDFEKKKNLDILRTERIREQMPEKQNSDLFLAQIDEESNDIEVTNTRAKRSYISQFYPYLIFLFSKRVSKYLEIFEG